MHLVYIDDSRDEKTCVFTALLIPVTRWRECFAIIKSLRIQLRNSDGISVHTEFHATKFLGGRGRLGAKSTISKVRRAAIFNQVLTTIASMPEVLIINVALGADRELWAFERLLNRVNRTMQAMDSHAILLCDEGKDAIYTRLTRRMAVYNPIPSNRGVWQDTGESHKNLPIEKIIEDPIFKDSRRSYFVQMVDFCAFALLRRENQIPSKNALGIHMAFDLLKPICFRPASPRDPDGIVR